MPKPEPVLDGREAVRHTHLALRVSSPRPTHTVQSRQGGCWPWQRRVPSLNHVIEPSERILGMTSHPFRTCRTLLFA